MSATRTGGRRGDTSSHRWRVETSGPTHDRLNPQRSSQVPPPHVSLLSTSSPGTTTTRDHRRLSCVRPSFPPSQTLRPHLVSVSGADHVPYFPPRLHPVVGGTHRSCAGPGTRAVLPVSFLFVTETPLFSDLPLFPAKSPSTSVLLRLDHKGPSFCWFRSHPFRSVVGQGSHTAFPSVPSSSQDVPGVSRHAGTEESGWSTPSPLRVPLPRNLWHSV